MLTKTEALLGDPLDWAVAKALDAPDLAAAWLRDRKRGYETLFSRRMSDGGWLLEQCVENGMLIERVDPQYSATMPKFKVTLDRWDSVYRGDNLLVAVCRAYVAYTLGLEVDIPQEVLDLPPAR